MWVIYWADVGYILIHDLCPVVYMGGQGLRKNITGKLITRISEEDVCGMNKILESCINARQKMTSTEEDFNNQVDRMTCSVNTSQPPSPATPVITQWTHEQNGSGGRDGSYSSAQEHGLLLPKASLAAATTECPICQQHRPTQSPQHGTLPQGDQPAP